LGKKELSAVLLVFGGIFCIYMALLATPISAQDIDDDTTGNQVVTVREETFDELLPRREPTVINIPRKPLPPTGGLPVYGMVAGSILAGASLLGLGIGIRRERRR
jgi:hypothetical protein